MTKSGRNRVNNNVSMDHWHMSLEFFFLADCSYLLLFLFTVIQITESIMPTKARSLDESLLNFVKAVASCLLCGLNFARSQCLVCAKGSVFLILYWCIPKKATQLKFCTVFAQMVYCLLFIQPLISFLFNNSIHLLSLFTFLK